MPKRFHFILLLSILITLQSCSLYTYNRYYIKDKKELRKLNKSNTKAAIYHIQAENYKIRVIVVGDSNLPVMLMLHGSPGSVATYNHIYTDTTFTNHYRLLSVDRPGYGMSNYGKSDTSILHQAKVILEATKSFIPADSFVVFGFSFGGPVAATIAGIDTARVKKLILVSTPLQPGQEKIYSISYFIRIPIFKILFAKPVQVANDEKLSHHMALKTILPQIQNIRANVLILHGLQDGLIYVENVKFGKENMKNAISLKHLCIAGDHHAFIWRNESLLKKTVLNFIL